MSDTSGGFQELPALVFISSISLLPLMIIVGF